MLAIPLSHLTMAILFPAKIFYYQTSQNFKNLSGNRFIGIRIGTNFSNNIRMDNKQLTPFLAVPITTAKIKYILVACHISNDNHRRVHHFDSALAISTIALPRHTTIPTIAIITHSGKVIRMDRNTQITTNLLLVQNAGMSNSKFLKTLQIKLLGNFAKHLHNLTATSNLKLLTSLRGSKKERIILIFVVNKSISTNQVFNKPFQSITAFRMFTLLNLRVCDNLINKFFDKLTRFPSITQFTHFTV